MMKISLQRFDWDSEYLNGAMAIYREYTRFSDGYIENFFRESSEMPDFIGLVAVWDGLVLGMSFGYHSSKGDWWHNCVAEQIGGDHPALQNAWVLTQLNVLNAYQGQGIGAQLHDQILARQPYPNVLLSTQVANKRAQKFYLEHGWQFLHAGFSFSIGDEPFAIMSKKIVKSSSNMD